MADLKINGHNLSGVEMGDGFMNALCGAAPLKTWISNTTALTDGTRYVETAVPKIAERSITLPFYVSGADRAAFEANKAAFYSTLYDGVLTISVPSRMPGVVFHLLYVSSGEYAQSRSGLFARIMVKFVEPNPAART